MESKTFEVSNISCESCTRTIQREVGELKGVEAVEADPRTKKVTVQWQPSVVSWEEIRSFLEEINYPPGR